MPKRTDQPITLGGQYSQPGGDRAVHPDGTCAEVNNFFVKGGRLAGRPPFVYDSLMSINGLANFTDNTNKVSRLLAVDATHKLYEKSASYQSETWSASLATMSGTRLTDFANAFGKVLMMFDDGSGLPTAAYSFDGTNVSSTPFPSAIASRTVTSYNGRWFLAYPRVTVINNLYASNLAYNVTGGIGGIWSGTNVTATNLTIGTVKIGRLSPTSTGASACSTITAGGATVTIASVVRNLVWRSDVRGVHASFDVPVTMETIILITVLVNTAYLAGDLMTSGGYRYRCTTGGTTALVAPAYGAVLGGTTADGTVVWTNEGYDIVGTIEDTVTNITEEPNFVARFIPSSVPLFGSLQTAQIYLRIKFYNTSVTALSTLAPIDISQRDGITDRDPSKKCYGQQLTIGDFYFPFFNQESSATATIDMNAVVWTEIGTTPTITAANTYQPVELVGYPTAAGTVADRYIVYYRNGFIQFQGTTDPDIPIRREVTNNIIGCLGPRARDTFENQEFFLAENDAYVYGGSGDPDSFAGEGMRERIFDHGAGWVNNPTLDVHMPLLAIDKLKQIVFVYTQRGKLFAYDIRQKAWATIYVSGNPEVTAMLWNENTGNFYVAFNSYGLTRLDYASALNDTLDNTASTFAADMNVVFVIETSDGARYDASLERIVAYYRSDITQTGQTVTAYVSFDQGATYPHSVSCTPSVISTNGNFLPLPIPIHQRGPTLTVKLARSGKAGETAWSLSPRLAARLAVLRGQIPPNPTAGSVT